MNIPKVLAASGVFLAALSVGLPDGEPGSPRSVAVAAGMGLLAAAVYLGAPKPGEVANEPGS